MRFATPEDGAVVVTGFFRRTYNGCGTSGEQFGVGAYAELVQVQVSCGFNRGLPGSFPGRGCLCGSHVIHICLCRVVGVVHIPGVAAFAIGICHGAIAGFEVGGV